MKLLAIETSAQICSIALGNELSIEAEYLANVPNIHDELAAEFVKRILNDFSLTLEDIDAIAVSSGPGSFTGLRIGAGLAKALCFKENENDYSPKLIAVPSLKSFIFNSLNIAESHNKQKIIAVIPAQKELVYYQKYFNGNYSNIEIANREELNDINLSEYLKVGPYFNESKTKEINEYSAKKIYNLGIKMYNQKEFTEPRTYTPDYIQEFIVKKKRKKLNI